MIISIILWIWSRQLALPKVDWDGDKGLKIPFSQLGAMLVQCVPWVLRVSAGVSSKFPEFIAPHIKDAGK